MAAQQDDVTDNRRTSALESYAESSLTWTHGQKTEDELLQRIWNLAGDVKALAAMVKERDER